MLKQKMLKQIASSCYHSGNG
uniref:Uncharacterized protein n=1 Tax=Rhizophora mucronata TaxID=61149 RepID=A0A2P2N3K4_RHIMU